MKHSPSVAAQPQSWPQVSSDSSSLQVPSPQPGVTSQRLQSPMPTLHLAFFQKLQSSEQEPQSSGQLAQVSPSSASQLSSLSHTKDPGPAHSAPTSAQESRSACTTSLENPRLWAASMVPWQDVMKVAEEVQ